MNTNLRTRITTPLAAAAMLTAATALAAPAQASGDPAGSGTATASHSGDGCSIHLYDGDDFDETDDNFTLTEPGEYQDLKNLPGADQDWTDEADSAKIGSAATVTVFKDTDFNGTSKELAPGSEHASLDPEPSSLKMTCDGGGDDGNSGDDNGGDNGGGGLGGLFHQIVHGLLGNHS